MKKGDKVEIISYTGMSANKYILLEDVNEINTLAFIESENGGGILGKDLISISKDRLRSREEGILLKVN